MIAGLIITFTSLDRFEGKVALDLSRRLTVVVGPNGSGKSTLLEAVAEVMTFLELHTIEGVESEVRKRVQPHRPTKPAWTHARVELRFHTGTRPSVGASLVPHLGEGQDGGTATVSVVKRTAERWTIGSIGLDDREVEIDTSGPIVTDSERKHQAEAGLRELDAEQERVKAQSSAKTAEIQNKIAAASASIQQPHNRRSTSPNHAVIAQLNSERQAAADEPAQHANRTSGRRKQLQQEIENARNMAVKLRDGTEASKTDVEAFRRSMSLPRIVYLHGAPDFRELVSGLTAQLGKLRDEKRAEDPGSPYIVMRDSLADLLRMDVTIDRTGGQHVLLVDDRPVTEVSTGTWYALGFAAICAREGADALVVWDEPETGLHATWARKVCDLMVRSRNRFLIATHRTEFVPTHAEVARVHKTIAHPAKRGEKSTCRIQEASTLLDKQSVAVVLGMEPSRILFTANAVIWVEGPSDVVYWRFWLQCAAQARTVELIEGFDYSFMFTAGSLLASETITDQDTPVPSDTVNLLHLVGASLVIVDTDFNPGAARDERITQSQLEALLRAESRHDFGFVSPAWRLHLKPRVRALAEAIDRLRPTDNLSRIISTWGREAENALTDDAFRRTLRRVFGIGDGDAASKIVDAVAVDGWSSYDTAIEAALLRARGQADLAPLWRTDMEGKHHVAKMSVITDKVRFAEAYVDEMRAEGLESVRPEARRIVESALQWVLDVKASYLQ